MSCCAAPLKSLDVRSAVINGCVQLVSSVVSIIFGIVLAVVYSGISYSGIVDVCPGGWSSSFFLIGGVVMLVAGLKRNYCCNVAGLFFALVNVVPALTNFSLISCMVSESYWSWHCWQVNPVPIEVDCSDKDYQIMIFMTTVLALASFARLFSVFWAIVLTSKAIFYRAEAAAAATTAVDGAASGLEIHRNAHARNNWLKFNLIGQLISTYVSVVFTIMVLFIVAYGVGSGDHDKRSQYPHNAGVSLWCAPVYFLTVYLGFRGSRFGENSSLISFVILNLVQSVLCLWELSFSALAIEYRFSLAVVNLVKDPEEPWRYIHVIPRDGWRFKPALVALHSIIIISSFLHFFLSVWGFAAATVAVHRDKACNCGNGCCCCGNHCCGGACGCCSCVKGGDQHAETSVPYYVVTTLTPGASNEGVRYELAPAVANGLGFHPADVNSAANSAFATPVHEAP